MTDNSGGLWVGTKGDGLLHIPDYRENEEVSAVTVTLLKVSKMLCLIYDGIKNFLFINWFKAVIWMAFG